MILVEIAAKVLAELIVLVVWTNGFMTVNVNSCIGWASTFWKFLQPALFGCIQEATLPSDFHCPTASFLCSPLPTSLLWSSPFFLSLQVWDEVPPSHRGPAWRWCPRLPARRRVWLGRPRRWPFPPGRAAEQDAQAPSPGRAQDKAAGSTHWRALRSVRLDIARVPGGVALVGFWREKWSVS